MVNETLASCSLLKAVTVKETDSVVDVAKKIHDFQERRILVVNKKNYPVGIISIVDINDRVVAKNKNLKTTKAKDIMSYPLHLVLDINTPAREALKKMVVKDNYYVPVVKDFSIKGLLTHSSLMRVLNKGNGKKKQRIATR